jgi:hypothetical protein
MTLEEVLERSFDASQHIDLCTVEVVNYGMGLDYVPNHEELMSFT